MLKMWKLYSRAEARTESYIPKLPPLCDENRSYRKTLVPLGKPRRYRNGKGSYHNDLNPYIILYAAIRIGLLIFGKLRWESPWHLVYAGVSNFWHPDVWISDCVQTFALNSSILSWALHGTWLNLSGLLPCKSSTSPSIAPASVRFVPSLSPPWMSPQSRGGGDGANRTEAGAIDGEVELLQGSKPERLSQVPCETPQLWMEELTQSEIQTSGCQKLDASA
jgi:hypothetical protein